MSIIPHFNTLASRDGEQRDGEQICNKSGWLLFFRKRAEEAEQQLAIQTERANDLESRLDALREIKNSAEDRVRELEHELEIAYHCIELSQNQLNNAIYDREQTEFMLRLDGRALLSAWSEIADLNQGINDLVERCREAEQVEHSSVEAAKSLNTLTAQLDQAKAHAEIHRQQADMLQRSFNVAWQERKQWYNEAQRAQAEVIEQAKRVAQLRQRLEAWVDLSQELEPFKDRAEADGYMLLEATKRQLAELDEVK